MAQSMKEIAIKDYISKIDFNRDDWKLSEIKEGLKKFLGEEPGVDVNYQKDVMINEIKGTAEEIKKVCKISIVFTDLDEKLKTLTFLAN